ncbi:hypothetical protein RHGRI_001909 [Rhododendron griersonianum]|uniref:Uncharacterized protein n=1 Tax=Rhododendron griersonianum TaxID=479676 RepID=A0AAV6LPH8_9ERIC|nr:hypothetical protein RHGRI_001909 [Rhododendron griersonianum]
MLNCYMFSSVMTFVDPTQLVMDLSYENGLATTCPRFVHLRILELQRRTDTRYVYYLIDSNNAEIRVDAAISYDSVAVKYIADNEFVKKILFSWQQFNSNFLNHPYQMYHTKFIMLFIPHVQQVPYVMNSYLLAPDEAVAMIHSGSRVWYVKIDNSRFTTRWMNVVHAHNIGKNYLLLFACVGHLKFDLFVFNKNNDEIAYDWTTIAPIQYSNAPNDWDSRKVFSRLTEGK